MENVRKNVQRKLFMRNSKSKDKKEATECQPINRRCSVASFFVVLLGFVLEVVLSGSTVTTHDAVELRESKVAVIVTVPGETPITTPREFTMAILSSEL